MTGGKPSAVSFVNYNGLIFLREAPYRHRAQAGKKAVPQNNASPPLIYLANLHRQLTLTANS
jgi:hypothetical protein